jgi:hypothetical protein
MGYLFSVFLIIIPFLGILNLVIFDIFNILVRYETWISRGMK